MIEIVRSKSLICCIALLVVQFATASDVHNPRSDFGLDDHHSDAYRWIVIEGHPVQIGLPRNMDVQLSTNFLYALDRLRKQIRRAHGVLPPMAVARLQTKVRIFLGDDCTEGGLVQYRRPQDNDREFGWIVLHCFQWISSVLDDAFHAGKGADDSTTVWGNPTLITHELAHAWHDLFMDDGWDNAMVEAFYNHALTCYVNDNDESAPWYWQSNKEEFFAEFTVMYFLSHWDEPEIKWNMDAGFRRMILRAWHEDTYHNYQRDIESNTC